MKNTIMTLSLIAMTSFAGCDEERANTNTNTTATPLNQHISAYDNNIEYMGRVSKSDPKQVQFTYPGVSIITSFTGTSLAMEVKPGSGYFMVELDNQTPFKVLASEKDSVIILSESLENCTHNVRIMYAQEGYWQRPAFRGLLIDKEAKTIKPGNIPSRRMEFIGNSITCGYGVEATSPNVGFTYDTENHYYTYAAITARELNAQELVVARSGIGIYKNYGGPIEGSAGFTMPDKYELTLFTDQAVTEDMEKWDHSLYRPDIVCLNLGTNDTSLDTYDTALLKEAYAKFVKHLRQTYPNAKIVLLCGSMMGGKALEDCQKVLDEVASESDDEQVYRFNFTPHNGSLGYGADWHPSIRQQRKMADELIPFVKEIMGW